VTVVGTGTWRPGVTYCPAAPGRPRFRQAAGYRGDSVSRNRAADRTAEATANDEAPERDDEGTSEPLAWPWVHHDQRSLQKSRTHV